MTDILSFGRPPSRRRLRGGFAPMPGAAPIACVVLLAAAYAMFGGQSAQAVATPFAICAAPPHTNCVMDGDTFYLEGQPIRVADIDAPETHPARCAYEAQLGGRATRRLQSLLNERAFALEAGSRDADRYGRKLRTVTRGGHSIGGMMVAEGLAREWTGRRSPWCG